MRCFWIYSVINSGVCSDSLIVLLSFIVGVASEGVPISVMCVRNAVQVVRHARG